MPTAIQVQRDFSTRSGSEFPVGDGAGMALRRRASSSTGFVMPASLQAGRNCGPQPSNAGWRSTARNLMTSQIANTTIAALRSANSTVALSNPGTPVHSAR